jgi:CubicO group peptidase (beta-lactamase class C family)
MALFEPLGITAFAWATGEDGIASAASGLSLRPRDLLRIGELVLARGEWGGRQVVSPAWLDASFKPAVATGDGLAYGRLWFLGKATTPALVGPQHWMAAFGNGGQRLWLMPDADLAVIVLSGAYDSPDQGVTSNRIWREIVLANLQRA